MQDIFQKAYDDFLNEFLFEIRNSHSFRTEMGQQLFKLGGGRFDEAIHIIIKEHGKHLQFVGEKAIELFINYLKLYHITEIDSDDLKMVLDYLSQMLKGQAADARCNAETYHASKGGSTFVFMNLDVLWVGVELEHRIPIILEKLKIEVRKYLIEAKNSVKNSTTLNIHGDVSKSQFNVNSNNSKQNNS